MGILQQVAYAMIPSAGRVPRLWGFRCPRCLREESVRDPGGVRIKAAGNPLRLVRGQHGPFAGLGPLDRRATPLDDMMTSTTTDTDTGTPPSSESRTARVWIDGVGCWQLSWQDRLSIGGPSSSPASTSGGSHLGGSHLAMLADLLRQHAVIHRCDESYQLEPIGKTRINGRAIDRTTFLKDGDQLTLGNDVQLRFRIPSPLSQSAVLEFLSSHRTSRRVDAGRLDAGRLDGVVLVQQHCLLGPGIATHVRCPNWDRDVVLYVQNNRLRCRPGEGLSVGGQPLTSPRELAHGDVLMAGDWRLRIEVE